MTGRSFAGRRYWLIGASTGLGAALAQALDAEGADLVLSSRDEAQLRALGQGLTRPPRIEPLDVSEYDDVVATADRIGPVDGMIYLAAAYWPMTGRQISGREAEIMMVVNYLGAQRAVAAVLPRMLAAGHGHIVLTGSLAAYRGLPGAIGYGASKAALLSLAETLRIDLAGSGVAVQIALPGFIKTRLTDKNDFNMPAIMTPDKAAAHMMRQMRGRRFAYAFPWRFAIFFRLSRFLPQSLYFRLFGGR